MHERTGLPPNLQKYRVAIGVLQILLHLNANEDGIGDHQACLGDTTRNTGKRLGFGSSPLPMGSMGLVYLPSFLIYHKFMISVGKGCGFSFSCKL